MNLISEQSPADYMEQAPLGKLPHMLPRYVQILSCDEDTRSVIVSDSELYIHAFLSRECFDSLGSHASISVYSHIILEELCLSTVAQAAGNHSYEQLSHLDVFFPIALNCFKASHASHLSGTSTGGRIGSPGPLEECAEVVGALKELPHMELKRRLGLKQFPIPQSLPDYGALSIAYCLMPSYLV
jgi:hypothetical protein